MIRSFRIGALVWAGLVGVGVAWGQQALRSAAPPAGPAPKEELSSQVIVVQEQGKAPQRCRVVKTWKEKDGSTAHQVQCLGTGEMMTLVGSMPGPGSRPARQADPDLPLGFLPLVPPGRPPATGRPPSAEAQAGACDARAFHLGQAPFGPGTAGPAPGRPRDATRPEEGSAGCQAFRPPPEKAGGPDAQQQGALQQGTLRGSALPPVVRDERGLAVVVG
jgi:hypothetical protein